MKLSGAGFPKCRTTHGKAEGLHVFPIGWIQTGLVAHLSVISCTFKELVLF